MKSCERRYTLANDSFLSGIFSHYTWIVLRGAGQGGTLLDAH